MRRVVSILILVLLITLGGGLPGVFAAEEESQEAVQAQRDLSLEEAVERALTASVTLEQAQKDVDRAWEVRKGARGTYVSDIRDQEEGEKFPTTGDLYTSVPGAGDPFISFLSSNGQWTISQKTLDMTEDATVLQTKGNYFDILKKQNELDVAKMSLQKAEDDCRIVERKAAVGMATNVEIQAAKSLLEAKKSAVEEIQAGLENSYRIFNKLVGLKPDDRPNLTTPIEFKKLEIPSLENKVAVNLSSNSNPYLWIKKEGYEISKYTWTFAESNEAGLIDKEKASLTFQDAVNDTRNKIYELYDSLQTLEVSYQSAQEGVLAAEEGLRVTQSMYETGMATKNDVLAKEIDLATAKKALMDIASLYAITGDTFEKPWLAFVA